MEEFSSKFENISADYDQLRSFSEIKTYNGNWAFDYIDTNGQSKSDLVSIQAGEVRTADRENKLLFKITRIAHVGDTSELIISIEPTVFSMRNARTGLLSRTS